MAEPKRQVRIGADGKEIVSWLARWRDPDGNQRKMTFPKKNDCQRHLDKVGADKARGAYVDLNNPITVAEACRANLELRQLRGSSYRRNDQLVRTHIENTKLGKRRMNAVLPSEVTAWATDRAQHLGASSMKKVIGLLKATYRDAMLDKIVGEDPTARLKVPSQPKNKLVPLTVPQVLALAAAMIGQYSAMVLVQAGLGLRIGEVLGLRLADVDFLRRTVRLEHQADPGSRSLVELKTDGSKRTIPLPQWVANILAEYLAGKPAAPSISCSCPKRVRCSRVDSPLLFHVRGGTPIARSYVYKTFTAGVEAANAAITAANAQLAADDVNRIDLLPADTTSHALRHHFASVLIAAGESVIAVAEWLGHDDAQLVLTTYGHLMPQSEDRMRRAIDAAYGLTSGSCAPGAPTRSAIKA